MEERKKKTEAISDDTVKDSLMELMSVLEKIDSLIGEIDTCKRTVAKLNNLLLRDSKDEWIDDSVKWDVTVQFSLGQ